MSAQPREAMTGAVGVDESAAPAQGELGSLLRAPSSRTLAAGAAAVLGRIVALEREGTVLVEMPGVTGRREARLAVPLSGAELAGALQSCAPIVLVFENGDPARPIIVGVVQAPSPAPAPVGSDNTRESAVRSGTPQVLEVDVDGKRVRITAQDEIVLECGSASITLRRNGRVVVRGTYVESYSDGTNRIKGGQVRIN